MSLNKKKMVREIGRRTRLKNRDVQAVIETLVDVWTEELVAGGRIEIEGFLVLACQNKIHRYLTGDDKQYSGQSCKLCVTTGKALSIKIRQKRFEREKH
jgi:nucleoid DNA-binding protein